MASVPVGTEVSRTVTRTGTKPKWMRWTASNTLKGNAVLPSGHRRLVSGASAITSWQDEDIYVQPVALPTTEARWRMAIYAPNGSYVTATGLGDLPTIGTPQVRIGVNAPSKATVKIPATRNTSGNILASTFSRWSDGHAEAVSRGMEVTVEFRDEKSGNMAMVFRGMIYQIESGEQITITAYDRLMDLAQYSDQYQGSGELSQNDTSKSRATSGTNYVYTMNNNIGTLLSAQSVDLLRIDALSQMGQNGANHGEVYLTIHSLPQVDGMTPERGRRIRRVASKFYEIISIITVVPMESATITANVSVVLYRRIGGGYTQIASTPTRSFSATADRYNSTATNEYNLSESVDWTIDGDPSEFFIGVKVEHTVSSFGTPNIIAHKAYAEFSGTRYTVPGTYYQSNDGNTWTQVSGDLPEVSIDFEHTGGAIATGSISVSGNLATIPQGSLPSPSLSSPYIVVVDLGIQIILTYFVTGSIGISTIIQKMIKAAGLACPEPIDSVGQTDYYTTSTYDYLTCIIELIRAKGFGIKTLINEAGAVVVKAVHTTSEAPVLTFTTNPAGAGEQAIVRHNLTAHWMAEKATQAYIAENATASGLPIALETDDALMDNSISELLQTPLRSIITDATMGTHDLMANAAGGKMRQLHTNVFEGTMMLAGYRLDIWDWGASRAGGMPIGIEVPEYGANGTAVPTEIILADGATQVSLDNIRTADRSELANSMGLSADANSNSADAVPDTVYIFARVDNEATQNTGISLNYAVNSVLLYDEDGNVYTLSNTNFIREVSDDAGYNHVCAVFQSSLKPAGFAPTKPIITVGFRYGVQGLIYATVTNPKNAYAGQHVHVDIRYRRTQ